MEEAVLTVRKLRQLLDVSIAVYDEFTRTSEKTGFILSTGRSEPLIKTRGKICMQSYKGAQVCKVYKNIIRIINIVSGKNLIDYLRKAYISKSLHKVLQNTKKFLVSVTFGSYHL